MIFGHINFVAKIVVFIFLLTSRSISGFIFNHDPDLYLNASQLIKSRGFLVEEHEVQTCDGYILGLQRIVNPFVKRPKKPILMVSGILATSTDWLLNEHGFLDRRGRYIEERHSDKFAFRKLNGKNVIVGGSLGFVLSQFGYDVWLGNNRGTTYSKKHTHYDYFSDLDYWKFTLDDLAMNDMPAMISYIRSLTHSDTLGYVGHSQGTFIMFALMSSRPEYNQIIKPFIALAPVTFIDHEWSLHLHDLTLLEPLYRHLPGVVLPPLPPQLLLQGLVCSLKPLQFLCGLMLGIVTGWNPYQINHQRIAAFAAHFPAGLSTRVVAHFLQLAGSGRFGRFDFGPNVNLIKYGQPTPPDYDLGQITSHCIALFHSANDPFANVDDVNRLKSSLNVALLADNFIPMTSWSHFDYMLGKDVGYYVNARIIDLLRNPRCY